MSYQQQSQDNQRFSRSSSSNNFNSGGQEGNNQFQTQPREIPQSNSHRILRRTVEAVGNLTISSIEKITPSLVSSSIQSTSSSMAKTYLNPYIDSIDDRIGYFMGQPNIDNEQMFDNQDEDDKNESDDDDLDMYMSNDDDDDVEGLDDDEEDEMQMIVLQQHWQIIRQSFRTSAWFRRVERILSETIILNSIMGTVSKPVELFFDICMDAYLETQKNTGDFEDFIKILKRRLHPTWDDRLIQPAHVLYSTLDSARSVMGIPSRFSKTVNDLWKNVLVMTDYAIDRVLPPEDEKVDIRPQQQFQQHQKSDNAMENNTLLGRISEKVAHSLNTRYQNWFGRVDGILTQNVLLKSLGGLIRPAEHFFDTAFNTFYEFGIVQKHQKLTFSEFVTKLKEKLGVAWDDRLIQPTSELYESASEVSDIELHREQYQQQFNYVCENMKDLDLEMDVDYHNNDNSHGSNMQ